MHKAIYLAYPIILSVAYLRYPTRYGGRNIFASHQQKLIV